MKKSAFLQATPILATAMLMLLGACSADKSLSREQAEKLILNSQKSSLEVIGYFKGEQFAGFAEDSLWASLERLEAEGLLENLARYRGQMGIAPESYRAMLGVGAKPYIRGEVKKSGAMDGKPSYQMANVVVYNGSFNGITGIANVQEDGTKARIEYSIRFEATPFADLSIVTFGHSRLRGINPNLDLKSITNGSTKSMTVTAQLYDDGWRLVD